MEQVNKSKCAVSPEMAMQEVERWLDFKKVSAKKREEYASAIETIADNISSGLATIDENLKIVQKLNFPIADKAGNPVLEQIEYAPRITYLEMRDTTMNVKAGDGAGRLIAIAAALSGKPIGYIQKFDTEDMTLLQAVCVFFL